MLKNIGICFFFKNTIKATISKTCAKKYIKFDFKGIFFPNIVQKKGEGLYH